MLSLGKVASALDIAEVMGDLIVGDGDIYVWCILSLTRRYLIDVTIDLL